MKKYLAAGLLSVAVIGSAFAQTDKPVTPVNPTTSTNSSHANMALKGNWRASKLIGLNVYNESNEKLGDINELLLDKNGKVSAAIIGVGGFLGMGEHDIAVSMDKLKFMEEPVRISSASTATTRETTTGAASSSTKPATSTTTAKNADANDWTPDHAVMNGSKDQLKAMPQFKYSDYN